MRAPIWAVLLLAAACARDDRAAGDTATAAATDTAAGAAATASTDIATRLAGTWRGRTYTSESDTGIAYTITQPPGPVGSAPAKLVMAGSRDTILIRTLSATDTLIVQESDPYMSPVTKQQTVAYARGRFVGPDSATGTVEFRPTKGGEPVRGTFKVKRVSPAP